MTKLKEKYTIACIWVLFSIKMRSFAPSSHKEVAAIITKAGEMAL